MHYGRQQYLATWALVSFSFVFRCVRESARVCSCVRARERERERERDGVQCARDHTRRPLTSTLNLTSTLKSTPPNGTTVQPVYSIDALADLQSAHAGSIGARGACGCVFVGALDLQSLPVVPDGFL
jgi:hypothetical protein